MIAIYDSGIGGFSILRQVRRELPGAPLVYLADQAHVPYGERSLEEILELATGATRWLLARRAEVVVLACNAASAAALYTLRGMFPETPFVGMEPAVKPAAEKTASGKVGVLATAATLQGGLFRSVVERFAAGVEVLAKPCPGLVEAIERGEADTPAWRARLQGWLEPLRAAGIDRLVLGCTHYPLCIHLIRELAGPKIEVLDPASAVAQQVGRVWPGEKDGAAEPIHYYTTGDPALLGRQARQYLDEAAPRVIPLAWDAARQNLRTR